MKISALCLALLLAFGSKASAALLINELMPAPVAGAPEWVELFNNTDESINLGVYHICDPSAKKALPACAIPANAYALLCSDTVLLRELYAIPLSAKLVQCALPSLNNSGDDIFLNDPSGIMIDSVHYAQSQVKSNTSLERISPNQFGYLANNWALSQDQELATPGRANSCKKSEYDLKINKIFADENGISINITNAGISILDHYNLQIFSGNTMNGIMLFNVDIDGSHSADTSIFVPISALLIPLEDDFYYITAQITSFDDMDSSNNTLSRYCLIGSPKNRLIINEIMYDPIAGQSEFIELTNISSSAFYLNGISICDATGPNNAYFYVGDLSVSPGEYFVLASDSTFYSAFPDLQNSPKVIIGKWKFGLNNDEDEAVLKLGKQTLDSVFYSAKWHSEQLIETKGVSLERIAPAMNSNDPAAWNSCSDTRGATPAQKNSRSINLPETDKTSISPNPFSRKRDAGLCIINLNFTSIGGRYSAHIFSIEGLPIKTLVNNNEIEAMNVLSWDGKNDSGYDVEIGAYILVIESIDARGESKTEKELITVGE